MESTNEPLGTSCFSSILSNKGDGGFAVLGVGVGRPDGGASADGVRERKRWRQGPRSGRGRAAAAGWPDATRQRSNASSSGGDPNTEAVNDKVVATLEKLSRGGGAGRDTPTVGTPLLCAAFYSSTSNSRRFCA
uniref:Uncharacterized protein n=1 Tax=Oryza meridionalis TaxID=40149 RepID=A0A0E0EXN3_9ORYZ